MAQDIRDLLKKSKDEKTSLPIGHEARFEAKLGEAFANSPNAKHTNKPMLFWLRIAAIVIVLVAVSYFGYGYLNDEPANQIVETVPEVENKMNQLTIGDLSPDLKKVEDFYLNGINVQLASLQITDENKELIDGYLLQLSELDKEYTSLNTELSKVGPTEATITALIDNLKLRLELLFKLKNKLKEFKNQENETIKSI